MRKLINKKNMSLLVLGMMLVSLLISMSPVQATLTTTYYELFNTEASQANPSASWFTFAKSAFTYAKVTDTQKFCINDSTSPPTAGYANFTFAALPTPVSSFEFTHYTHFYFDFNYTNNLNALAMQNHSAIDFKLAGTSTICDVYVYGLNATVAGNRNRIMIKDYAGVEYVNATCLYNYTYGIAYEPDYYSNTITVVLYNESAGGTVMNTTYLSLNSETNMMKFYMTNPAGQSVYMRIDDFTLVKEVPNYTAYKSIDQMIVIFAIPVILIVGLLFMILTNTITKEFLVGYLVIFLLAMVTLAFILS